MRDYVLSTRDMAHWYLMLGEAELAARQLLGRQEGRYVAVLLQRYLGQSGRAQRPLSLAQLSGQHAVGNPGVERLQEMADQCLVVAGLYPEQPARFDLPLSSVVDFGRNTYARLAVESGNPLFALLCQCFVQIMDVLQRLRELEEGCLSLDPLSAFQLWQDTGSRYAWRTLRHSSTALPASRYSVRAH